MDAPTPRLLVRNLGGNNSKFCPNNITETPLARDFFVGKRIDILLVVLDQRYRDGEKGAANIARTMQTAAAFDTLNAIGCAANGSLVSSVVESMQLKDKPKPVEFVGVFEKDDFRLHEMSAQTQLGMSDAEFLATVEKTKAGVGKGAFHNLDIPMEKVLETCFVVACGDTDTEWSVLAAMISRSSHYLGLIVVIGHGISGSLGSITPSALIKGFKSKEPAGVILSCCLSQTVATVCACNLQNFPWIGFNMTANIVEAYAARAQSVCIFYYILASTDRNKINQFRLGDPDNWRMEGSTNLKMFILWCLAKDFARDAFPMFADNVNSVFSYGCYCMSLSAWGVIAVDGTIGVKKYVSGREITSVEIYWKLPRW